MNDNLGEYIEIPHLANPEFADLTRSMQYQMVPVEKGFSQHPDHVTPLEYQLDSSCSTSRYIYLRGDNLYQHELTTSFLIWWKS